MASGKVDNVYPVLHDDYSQADVIVVHCDNKQCQPNLKRLTRELKLRKLTSLSFAINPTGPELLDVVKVARADVVYLLHVCNVSKRKLNEILKLQQNREHFNRTNTLVYVAGKLDLKPVFKEFTSTTVGNLLDIQKLAGNVLDVKNQRDIQSQTANEAGSNINGQSATIRRSLPVVSELSEPNARSKSEILLPTLPNFHFQDRPKSECNRQFYSLPRKRTDRYTFRFNNNQNDMQGCVETLLTSRQVYDDNECFISSADDEEEHYGTFVKRSSIQSAANLSMEEKIGQYTQNPCNEQYQKDLVVHIIPELQRAHDVRTLSEWLAFDQSRIKDKILQELEMLIMQMTLSTTDVTDLIHVVENVMRCCLGTVMGTDDIFTPLQVLTECMVVMYVLNSGTSNSELYIQTARIFTRVHTELGTLSTLSTNMASKQIKTLLHLIEQFSHKQFKRNRLDSLLSEPDQENILTNLSGYEFHEQFVSVYLLVNMVLHIPSTKTAEVLLLLVKLMYDSLSKRDKTRTDLYYVLYTVNRGIAFRINKGPDVYNIEEWHSFRDKMLTCLKIYITSSRLDCQWRVSLLDHLHPLLFSADKEIVKTIVKIFEKTSHKRDKHGYLDRVVLKHVEHCLIPVNLKIFPGQMKTLDRSKHCPRWLKIPGKMWHNMDVSLHLLLPTKSCFCSSSLDEYRFGADKVKSKKYMNTLEVMRLLQFKEKHSNLVKLIAFQYRPIPVFYLTENHKNLHSFLLETGQFHKWLSWERLCRMSINVIDATQFLHSKGFVHRNLTTFSFCINAQKTVMLQDFSLTKSLPQQENTQKSFINDVSEEEIPLHYSAPESILDDRFDYKTDTWMLGLVIHGIFTHGAFPYTPSGFHLEKVLEYVVFQDLKPTQWPCIPEEIFAAIIACMHTNPEDRGDLWIFRKRVEIFIKDCGMDRPKRLSTLSEEDTMYPPPVHDEPERTLPELFVRLKQELDPKHSYYNMRCSTIRPTVSRITKSEVTDKHEPRRYNDEYSMSLSVEEIVSKSFVEEELPQLTSYICTRTLKMNAVPSKLRRYISTMDHEYVLHYKCRPGQNLLDLVLCHHFGALGLESTEIYYLGLIYNLVKFVNRMHEHHWLLRDICGCSVYVEDGSLRIYMPRVGRLKRLVTRQNVDDFVKDDILDDRTRWLPVEVLQNGLYSKQSDIYMLGMTIWEVYTALDLGNSNGGSDHSLLEGKPFSTIPKSELLNELYSGVVPRLPRSCPLWLYNLLTSCWNRNRIFRPTAQQLLTEIKSMIQVHPRKDLIVQMVDLETRQRHISERSVTTMLSDTTLDNSMDNMLEENPYLLPVLGSSQTSIHTEDTTHSKQSRRTPPPNQRHCKTRRRPEGHCLDISDVSPKFRQRPGRQNIVGKYEPSGFYENETDPLNVSRPETPGSLSHETIPEVHEEIIDSQSQGTQSIQIKISPPEIDKQKIVREDSGVFSVNSARCSRSSSYDQQSIEARSSLGYHSSGTMQHARPEQKLAIHISRAMLHTGHQDHNINHQTSNQSGAMPILDKQREHKLYNQTFSVPSKPKGSLVIPPIPVRTNSKKIHNITEDNQNDSRSDDKLLSEPKLNLYPNDNELNFREYCQYDVPQKLNKPTETDNIRTEGLLENQRSKDDIDVDSYEPKLIRFGSCHMFHGNQRLSSQFRQSYV